MCKWLCRAEYPEKGSVTSSETPHGMESTRSRVLHGFPTLVTKRPTRPGSLPSLPLPKMFWSHCTLISFMTDTEFPNLKITCEKKVKTECGKGVREGSLSPYPGATRPTLVFQPPPTRNTILNGWGEMSDPELNNKLTYRERVLWRVIKFYRVTKIH